MVTETTDVLQFIPPVIMNSTAPASNHEFYRSRPHHEYAGRRKDGQNVIIGEDEEEDASAEEIGTAILEIV
jgi:hypothetical protein